MDWKSTWYRKIPANKNRNLLSSNTAWYLVTKIKLQNEQMKADFTGCSGLNEYHVEVDYSMVFVDKIKVILAIESFGFMDPNLTRYCKIPASKVASCNLTWYLQTKICFSWEDLMSKLSSIHLLIWISLARLAISLSLAKKKKKITYCIS